MRFSSKEVDRYYLKMPILAAINQKVPNLKPRLKFEPTKIEKVLSENRTQKRRLLAEIEGILEEHKTTSNLSEVEIRLLIAKNENVIDRVHRRTALRKAQMQLQQQLQASPDKSLPTRQPTGQPTLFASRSPFKDPADPMQEILEEEREEAPQSVVNSSLYDENDPDLQVIKEITSSVKKQEQLEAAEQRSQQLAGLTIHEQSRSTNQNELEGGGEVLSPRIGEERDAPA